MIEAIPARALAGLICCIAVSLFVLPSGAQAQSALNDELFVAAEQGDVNGVRDRLNRHADIEYVQPGSDRTVLQAAIYANQGSAGQRSGPAYVQIVKLLLVHEPKLEEHAGAKGTALFTAVMVNGEWPQTAEEIEIIKLLLDHGASTAMAPHGEGTPLHAAALGLHIDAARLLLEHHAKVNAVDSYGNTPLQVVMNVANGSPEDKQPMIKLLQKAGGK